MNKVFVSAVLYGVNKGINNLMSSKAGTVICRYISKEMFNFLMNRGVASPDMKNKDLEEMLVNKLKLAKKIEIIEDDKNVILKIYQPTLTDFLEEMMKNKVPLILCPFLATVTEVYRNRGVRIFLKDGNSTEYGIELVFSKTRH